MNSPEQTDRTAHVIHAHVITLAISHVYSHLINAGLFSNLNDINKKNKIKKKPETRMGEQKLCLRGLLRKRKSSGNPLSIGRMISWSKIFVYEITFPDFLY